MLPEQQNANPPITSTWSNDKGVIPATSDRDILLKYLCAALPYGVMVQDDMGRTYKLNLGNAYLADLCYGDGGYIEPPIKPCLRPMFSMTEEEKLELSVVPIYAFTFRNSVAEIEWLLENHFDFMGLIDEGLAIAVTDEFNPYKD